MARRRHRLRRGLATTGTILVVFACALVVADLRLESTNTPSATVPALVIPGQADGAPFQPPLRQDGGVTAPTLGSAAVPAASDLPPPSDSQRFAWAPADGASGYHVELFHGNSLVFAADTTRPEISIPAKWKFNRRVFQLDSLEYRWYVWPIVSGIRTSEAIVQAKLVVRDR